MTAQPTNPTKLPARRIPPPDTATPRIVNQGPPDPLAAAEAANRHLVIQLARARARITQLEETIQQLAQAGIR